jgi:hypothetical protein
MYEYEDCVWIIKRVNQRPSPYWTGYKDWFTGRSEHARYFGSFKSANVHCEEMRFEFGIESRPILCYMINDPRTIIPVDVENLIREKLLVEEHEDRLGQNRFE